MVVKTTRCGMVRVRELLFGGPRCVGLSCRVVHMSMISSESDEITLGDVRLNLLALNAMSLDS